MNDKQLVAIVISAIVALIICPILMILENNAETIKRIEKEKQQKNKRRY